MPAWTRAPVVEVGGRSVPLRLVRNPRARRYILRVNPDRTARVTIPRGGSAEEALRFVGRQEAWLEKQFQRLAERPVLPVPWGHGTEILFRGEKVRLQVEKSEAGTVARFGRNRVVIPDGETTPHVVAYSSLGECCELGIPCLGNDLRPFVQREMWRLAISELTGRTLELAGQKGFLVNRVWVRNQRSRWGSCSRRGTISLNWRLIQVPESVRDYIILHELAHLREMNHSRRFWQVVEEICPDFQLAEDYLRKHSGLLR